jgi:hypothetical protein
MNRKLICPSWGETVHIARKEYCFFDIVESYGLLHEAIDPKSTSAMVVGRLSDVINN